MDLSRFPRRRYTAGPTPIEPLPRFTAALAAACPPGRRPEIWVKRDDQLGLFPGGNKTRKLEFLVADALARGADTLVTCGAPQSNHCRITLSAAVKEGLRCRLVIEERVPQSFREDASGNHFLFRLMGVDALRVVPAGTDMAAAMQEEVAAAAAAGRRAYVIPGGGSNAIGGLGYVACTQELLGQWFDRGLRIDHVVVGSGSSAGGVSTGGGFEGAASPGLQSSAPPFWPTLPLPPGLPFPPALPFSPALPFPPSLPTGPGMPLPPALPANQVSGEPTCADVTATNSAAPATIPRRRIIAAPPASSGRGRVPWRSFQ